MLGSDLNLAGTKVIESPILLNEIDLLKSELKQERRLKAKAQYKHYMDILKKLPPIHVSVNLLIYWYFQNYNFGLFWELEHIICSS